MGQILRLLLTGLFIVGLIGSSFGCATSNSPAAPTTTKAPSTEPTTAPAATKPAAPAAASTSSAGSVPSAKTGEASVKPLDPPVKVKVAVGSRTSSVMTAVFIADNLGYLKEEGLILEELQAGGTTDAVPALATGEIDVLTGSVSAALYNVLARGIDVRIVGAQSSSRLDKGATSQALLVRKDLVDSGKVKKTADLKGLKIATSGPGQLTEIGLARILAEAGLTLKDIQEITLQSPEMTVALKNGSIDAAVQQEPARIISIDENSAVVWKELKDVLDDNHTMTLWMYSPKFAKTEAGKRFLVAVLRGARAYADAFWYNKPNKQKVAEFLAGHMKVKPQDLDRMIPAAVSVNGELNMKSLEGDQDFHYSLGLVKEKASIGKYVDTVFLDYAIGRIGPYKP